MAKQLASLPAVGRPSGWLWLILAYGAAIRAFNLTEPWGRHLVGIDGAWHSIIGRNLLRHGFFATHGAPVLNPGLSVPGEWTYYLHHPPLLDWIVALSFRIFGIHEWSARLVPLVFSLGTIVLTYRLVSRLFAAAQPPTLIPLTAAFFMATIPMSAIYGMHVDYHGAIVLGFALAAITAYERLIGTGRPTAALIAMVTLCADWPGFYLPPLSRHAWWSRQSGRRGGSAPGEAMDDPLLSRPLLLAAIFYFRAIRRPGVRAGSSSSAPAPQGRHASRIRSPGLIRPSRVISGSRTRSRCLAERRSGSSPLGPRYGGRRRGWLRLDPARFGTMHIVPSRWPTHDCLGDLFTPGFLVRR
jgi:hypothetical protein